MKKFAVILLLLSSCAYAEPQCYDLEELTVIDQHNVYGGKGTLYGEYALTSGDAPSANTIKQIAFMTLKPGDSIGLHSHSDYEEAYIILSGQGMFTDGRNGEYMTGPQSVIIISAGESVSLENTGNDDLVFLNILAQKK